MRTKLLLLLVLSGLHLSSLPLIAHHAFSAEFDGNKQVNLKGNITKMDWINPHAWIYIDVKSANGKVDNWAIELGPPNALIKRGWTKKSVPVGAEVLVVGYQAKDGSMRANGRDLSFPDGRKLFAASSNADAPDKDGK
jgi:hypothetical protein